MYILHFASVSIMKEKNINHGSNTVFLEGNFLKYIDYGYIVHLLFPFVLILAIIKLEFVDKLDGSH